MTRHLPDQAPRCLIVDDDGIVRALLSCSLEAAGFEVICAISGDEGLDKVQSWQPDFIFMDIEMPGRSGIETTAMIRANPAMSYHPVIIAFTSLRTPDIRAECLGAGMDDFLQKPFSWDNLKQMLERWGAAAPI